MRLRSPNVLKEDVITSGLKEAATVTYINRIREAALISQKPQATVTAAEVVRQRAVISIGE